MSPAHKRRLAYLLLLITPGLLAVNYVLARMVADTVAPHALAFGRWALAGIVMFALCWREIFDKRAAIAGEWRQFLVFGMLGMWICGAFVYIGALTTQATNIGLLYSISPVLIALVSASYLKERMGVAQAVGVMLALAGVWHVLLKGQWASLAQVRFIVGDLWILAAVLSWTAYALLLKAWPSAFGPAARLALTCAAGALILLPLAIIEAWWFRPLQVSWKAAAYVLTVALLPGVGAYLAHSFMQRELGAGRVGVALYLGPLYTATLAWALLDEPMRGFHWIGVALILPGIFLATRPARNP